MCLVFSKRDEEIEVYEYQKEDLQKARDKEEGGDEGLKAPGIAGMHKNTTKDEPRTSQNVTGRRRYRTLD